MRTTRIPCAAGLAAATALLASAAAAQNLPDPQPREGPRPGPAPAAFETRLAGGIAFGVVRPLGTFRRYVSTGYGVQGHALYRLDRTGALAVRLDGGATRYGRETIRTPLGTGPGGGRVRLDLTTTNDFYWLGVGPQLTAPRGAVRPYAHGTAGFTYLATTSRASGSGPVDAPFAQTTNLGDGQFAWGAGGGVLVPVHRGARTLVAVDVGGQYRDNGRNARYLRRGGIRDVPGGGVALDVIRSRADVVTWHVGVSVGGRGSR
jgi:hypothetical protein